MATKKKQIAVADCETDPFKKGRTKINPFMWGFYDGTTYHEFAKTIDFLNHVKELDIIVYAHNGGKFDWFFILEHLEEFSDLMVINGRLSKFKIGNCEFRDSYNILPIPLAAYKKDEIDYAIMEEGERDKPKNRREIQKYLRSDCIYLFDLVSHFISNYGNGLTLAGSALKFWQKHCDQVAPRTSESFYSQFKEFYYGGRVEVFRSGIIREDFNVIDINSAYPYAMMNLHPYGRTYAKSSELPTTISHIQRSFISLKCVSAGAFPFREKTGLAFPCDDIARVYMVTGWEYLAGLDTNSIHSVEIIDVYTFSDSIRFDEYINHFYALKSESERDSPDYIIAKLFLNSLYGKFGSNPSEYMEYTISKPEHIIASQCDGFEFSAMLGEWALLQKPLEEEKQHYFNVAVAASITGFVRAMLFRSIKQCKGVIYCDTDSIAAKEIAGLELSDSKLGGWKVEAVCDWAAVAGKKLYCFHTKTGKYKKASKGARLTNKQIIKVAKGVPQLYEPIAPSFSLKRGINITNRLISKNA
jgi:hypothetical protein